MMPNPVKASLILGLLSVLFLSQAVPAANASEVTGYNETGFQGQEIKWKIPAGYRHLLVRNVNFPNKVLRSLMIGAGLKVKAFPLPNFGGYPNDLSPGQIRSLSAKSLIIFPASQAQPSGLQIFGRTTGQIKIPVGHFFPLPEAIKLKSICLDSKTFALTPMKQVIIYGRGLRATLYSGYQCSNQSVSVGGPGKGGSTTGLTNRFNPHQQPLAYMQSKLKAVKLEDLNLYIPPKPVKVQPIKGKVIPGASIIPSIQGDWNSNINLRHQIVQFKDKTKGKIRTVPQTGPVADFTLKGRDLVAVFINNQGQKEVVKGRITQMLNSGYALRIEWDNKVVLFRNVKVKKPGDTVPPDQVDLKAPDVAGTWKSSIGLEYVFMQNNNQFTWQVKQHSENGQGAIKGKKIQASWSGDKGNGSGSAEITKVDSNNKALEIRWNSGVIFFR